MPLRRRKFLHLAASVAALPVFSIIARAQEWPTRPVTMVIPFAAGGAADIVGRILAVRLSELLGRQVLVENVPGAGGMTGTIRVARAAPDGYQFVLGSVGTHAANQTLYKNPGYNAATDFAPVALIVDQPIVLVTRKDLPANNLQEFIAYARANQAKMQYGTPGVGSSSHLACMLLNATIGVDVTHIPYRAGATIFGTQDLIAGRIDYMCPAITAAIPQIEGNQVKAITILSRDRSLSLPALASAHEQGLTGFECGTWIAIFLPKVTPTAIVQKMHFAAVAAMATPSVQAKLQEIGATVVAPERRSPEYLQQFVEREIAKWAAAIKAAGISAD